MTMTHIRITPAGTEWPYELARLRIDFPQVSFPIPYDLADLAEVGIFPVAQAEPPEAGSHEIPQEIAPVLIDGVWTRQWTLRPMTPEEVAARVPQFVSMRQARLALLAAGLLAGVDAAISALPSPDGEAARIDWEYAVEVRRSSPLIATLGPALGLDDAAIDALFIAAGAIE